MTKPVMKEKASFRDPSGFVFRKNGILYRQINQHYREDYELLLSSGLYDRLVEECLLIPHREADIAMAQSPEAYKVIEPQEIELVSYPYEWSFSQLKDAALATLRIQQIALKHGMTLKDSSAYNVQFHHGKPTLIDTLSFEKYKVGLPWIAYRQLCQHFLAPLALMSYVDIRLGRLLSLYIDGIPLDLASQLLPRATYLRLSILLHIHMHARAQRHYKRVDTGPDIRKITMSRQSLDGLIDNLITGVKALRWKSIQTDWGDYYNDDSYTPEGFKHKREIVNKWIEELTPGVVWDLGANIGEFSRLAAKNNSFTVSWDFDPGAVEQNYLQMKEQAEQKLLPLLLDLTSPSPAIGWANMERRAFSERGPADLVMALALVHHLRIANNVPLDMVAEYFAAICRYLIVEFIPKDDKKVQILLGARQDIFTDYHQEGFEMSFSSYFNIRDIQPIRDSKRVLYLMEKIA